jgi:hypothetical protein
MISASITFDAARCSGTHIDNWGVYNRSIVYYRQGQVKILPFSKPTDVGKQVHELCHYYLLLLLCACSRCPSEGLQATISVAGRLPSERGREAYSSSKQASEQARPMS